MAHSKPRDAARQRRPSIARDQLLLPFTAPDPLRVALASIDRRFAGVKSEARMRQVREMVMAVWLCGQNDGCRASVARLIGVANTNCERPVIRTESTARRALREAERIGLLTSDPAWNEIGRAPSERAVCEERIAELVRQSRQSAREVRKRKSDRHLTVTCSIPDRHSKRNKTSESSEPSYKRSTVDRAADQKSPDWSEAERAEVRRLAEETRKRIGCRCRHQRDRDLLLKACALVGRGVYSEQWLASAANAAQLLAKRRPWGYFQTCLVESAAGLGRNLFADLKQLTVPAELLQPPSADWDLSARLCGGGLEA